MFTGNNVITYAFPILKNKSKKNTKRFKINRDFNKYSKFILKKTFSRTADCIFEKKESSEIYFC